MTNKQLERGIELRTLKDFLLRKKEHLEKMKALCFENMDIEKKIAHTYTIKSMDLGKIRALYFENMDIAKKTTHTFTVDSMENDGGDSDVVEVLARAAYRGICSDIETIEKEIDKLNKEFSNL